jgi:hypothetical protein
MNNRSRIPMYHSLVPTLRKDRHGDAFVRVLDRYYPGPPGPEYSTVIDGMEAWEARALAHALLETANIVDEKNATKKLADDIAANTTKIAAEERATHD